MPPGYTWNDFLLGRPHIDHIIPLRAFNFTPEKDYVFKLGWTLSNLRLLPGPDNWAKSGKLAAPFQPNLAFDGQSASNSVAHAGRFNLSLLGLMSAFELQQNTCESPRWAAGRRANLAARRLAGFGRQVLESRHLFSLPPSGGLRPTCGYGSIVQKPSG
jgi:hypothetical protein